MQYIHANYRFVVDPRGDYRAQAIDADIHLDWTNVLQIVASAQSQLSNCPICLSTPVAPRMAKCGHIFCLPCLIRYMHSTDESNPVPEKKARSKKCPICWDSVYISETRPVRWFTGQEGEAPREGEDVVLRLISRRPGSTLALPRDNAESLDASGEIPWFFAAEVADYARIMKGTEDYMVEQYEQEIEEIQVQEREDELMFGDETQWARKAVAAIGEAKDKVKGIGNHPTAPKQPSEKKSKPPPIRFDDNIEDRPDFYMIQHAAKSGRSFPSGYDPSNSTTTNSQYDREDPPVNRAVAGGENLRTQVSANTHYDMPFNHVPDARMNQESSGKPQQTTHESPFYFYEALLHYYLSPLDIRILKAAFGDFSSFPTTILPRVERVSTGHIIDDELRKRAKYLAHLPRGCEVGFLECDWTDVVIPEVLEGFAAEIERRRKKNREKEIREERERARAEKDEDEKRWANARRRKPSAPTDTVSSAPLQTLAPVEEKSEASSWEGLGMASTSPSWSSTRQQQGSSFASLASPSTSPVAARTVWGTAAITPVSPVLQPILDDLNADAPENDGWLQNWERDLLDGDELVAQVEAHSISGGSSQAPISSNGKKKKNKKITLMTTNARRGA
ncbi:MAG: hypothetical protein HETSPECPRED_006401 [Heterodermia speciosa]|uniref:RING-type domain-containing protein n=1 Tax=Heterodermia speciosa TaxID=116794 RepID=A0A8H3FIR8_9LECA|nr:MAG: hypothetical protein HETSPECPRED_006401 [Heterodermia speciosa]